MKKSSFAWIVAILGGLGLLLVSCSRSQTVASGAANNSGSDAGEQRALPLPMQLALGTLKLEETDMAVTPEQAAKLLPLWKAAKSLGNADNITPKELEGLYKQIQGTMTSEQVKAIQSMDLSGQNIAQLAQELGIEMPMGGPANLSSEQQATMEAFRQSRQQSGGGGFPGGGPDGGGPGGPPPGGEGVPPGGGPQGSSGNNNQTGDLRSQGGSDTVLYQIVINLLEKKIQ